ncbi:TPA: filamentous hemagglutinin N-terminal domain-containing protein [Proteus mirabilis]|nr:filamentous hemagglutinin N-terminal domain-containing protein [Proteus mirabilis]MDM3724808.1 filamentous hemagglutinin N-terminal domain-containing protein [Proteus mirabilis]MDU3451998.1 filamentous hemagglutinin N-terminal domain-containing protein [Proteus mirabilis]MDU3487384.1 filamentous hemagglutinin N-terminal domain-containing protein [Proteus mirabilis]
MHKKDISRKQRLISYCVIYLTAIYPLHPAWGSVITSSDKTITINQQNNIPIINIATPNDSGVSHNRFNVFNVNKQGQYLIIRKLMPIVNWQKKYLLIKI